MMKITIITVLLCAILGQSYAFLTPTTSSQARSSSPSSMMVVRNILDKGDKAEDLFQIIVSAGESSSTTSNNGFGTTSIMAGLATGLCSFVSRGMAASDEYEMAELPPPWVPAIFAVVLLAGVGVLTGSLGDVLDEEASLGLQSGARAKKEIERSRSSYFKK